MLHPHSATRSLRIARVAHAFEASPKRIAIYMSKDNGVINVMHSDDSNILSVCVPPCPAVAFFFKLLEEHDEKEMKHRTRVTLVLTGGYCAVYATHGRRTWEFSPPSDVTREVQDVTVDQGDIERLRRCTKSVDALPTLWVRNDAVSTRWNAVGIANVCSDTSRALTGNTARFAHRTSSDEHTVGFLFFMDSNLARPEKDVITLIHCVTDSYDLKLHSTLFDQRDSATEMWIVGTPIAEATVRACVARGEDRTRAFLSEATADGNFETRADRCGVRALGRSHGSLQTIVDLSILRCCRPVDHHQARTLELRVGLISVVARVLAHLSRSSHVQHARAFNFDKAFFVHYEASWVLLVEFCRRLRLDSTPHMDLAADHLADCGLSLVLRHASADCLETASTVIVNGTLCDVHTQIMHARETFVNLATHLADPEIFESFLGPLRDAMLAGRRVVEKFVGICCRRLDALTCENCSKRLDASGVSLGVDSNVCPCKQAIVCADCDRCSSCHFRDSEKRSDVLRKSARAIQSMMHDEKHRADLLAMQVKQVETELASTALELGDTNEKLRAQIVRMTSDAESASLKIKRIQGSVVRSERSRRATNDDYALSLKKMQERMREEHDRVVMALRETHANELNLANEVCACEVLRAQRQASEAVSTTKVTAVPTLVGPKRETTLTPNVTTVDVASQVEPWSETAPASEEAIPEATEATRGARATHEKDMRDMESEICRMREKLKETAKLHDIWKSRYEYAIGKADTTSKMYTELLATLDGGQRVN